MCQDTFKFSYDYKKRLSICHYISSDELQYTPDHVLRRANRNGWGFSVASNLYIQQKDSDNRLARFDIYSS